MRHIEKEYTNAFALEPTKLRRIVETIHGRLIGLTTSIPLDSFEVWMSDHWREELTVLDQVLALDNDRRHAIRRLIIRSTAPVIPAGGPRREVEVCFGRPVMRAGSNASNPPSVTIDVRSDDAGWADGTLSDLEEQVERTWTYRTRYIVGLAGLLAVVLIGLAAPFVYFRAAPDELPMWLTTLNVDSIEVMLRQHATLAEEDLRAAATMQFRNRVNYERPRPPVHVHPTRRTVLLAAPLSVVAACTVVLLFTCYPDAVFVWGDGQARYDRALQRRGAMWTVLVSVTLIGVGAGFFAEALSSWITAQ